MPGFGVENYSANFAHDTAIFFVKQTCTYFLANIIHTILSCHELPNTVVRNALVELPWLHKIQFAIRYKSRQLLVIVIYYFHLNFQFNFSQESTIKLLLIINN